MDQEVHYGIGGLALNDEPTETTPWKPSFNNTKRSELSWATPSPRAPSCPALTGVLFLSMRPEQVLRGAAGVPVDRRGRALLAPPRKQDTVAVR